MQKNSTIRLMLSLVIPLMIALGCGAPTPWAAPPQPTPGSGQLLTIDFIDVGQGDAILFRDTQGKAVLIDGGNQDGLALKYLQAAGVKTIDLMIATHPHSDHIGGLIQVLQAVPVAKVITNGQMHTTPTYEQFLDAISKANKTIVITGDITMDWNLDRTHRA
jgi:competence protein ComEC